MIPKKPPPTIPVPAKYLTVRVNDPRDVAQFIADLKQSVKDSVSTGGCYSAFLALANGQKLQVEVGLPLRLEN